MDVTGYLKLGSKRAYNFTEEQKREDIWPIFRRYEARKRTEKVEQVLKEGARPVPETAARVSQNGKKPADRKKAATDKDNEQVVKVVNKQ